jgi:hypothetical protein
VRQHDANLSGLVAYDELYETRIDNVRRRIKTIAELSHP